MKKKNLQTMVRIGVTGPDKGGWLVWQLIRLGVRLAGGRAERITPRTFYQNGGIRNGRYHGFIIAGGTDIDPQLYNAAPEQSENRVVYDAKRDKMEFTLVRRALLQKIPVLGICRGMQMLNVALGGNLHQDLTKVYPTFLPTRGLWSKVFLRRKVQVHTRTKLSAAMGEGGEFLINSLHHQAVRHLGRNLRVSARTAEGMVQAIEKSRRAHPFFMGVQWHPELILYQKSARSIFYALLQAAEQNRRQRRRPKRFKVRRPGILEKVTQ